MTAQETGPGSSAEFDPEERLDKLFEFFEQRGDTDLLMLRVLWDEGDVEARKRAWVAAEKVIVDTGRQRVLDDARRRMALWLNNYDAAYGVAQGSIGGSEGFPAASVRQAAIPPLLDAVVGTLAGDHLSDQDYEVLSDAFLRLRSGIEGQDEPK